MKTDTQDRRAGLFEMAAKIQEEHKNWSPKKCLAVAKERWSEANLKSSNAQ